MKEEQGRRIDFFFRYPLVFPAVISCMAIVAAESHVGWALGLLLLSVLVGWLWVSRYIILCGILLAVAFYVFHTDKIYSYHQQQDQILAYTKVDLEFVIEEEVSSKNHVVEVVTEGAWERAKFLWRHNDAFDQGDKITGSFYMKPPSRALNPGQFDQTNWLKRKNVLGQLIGKGERIRNAQPKALDRFFSNGKEYVKNRLAYGIEDPANVSVIHSMFLGEKQNTSSSIVSDFRYGGVMHVFAVSGLHVMMVGGIVILMLKMAGLPRSWTVIVGVLLMFIYAGITGWQISAARAAVMAAVFLSGWIFKRNPCVFSSLALAAIVLCAWDSHQIFSVGFQLSFGVVVTIFLLQRCIFGYFKKYTELDPFLPPSLYTIPQVWTMKSKQYVGNGVAVTLAAWVGSAPLIAYYFKMISFVGILLSVPVVLALTGVIWLSLMSILLGSFWQPLAYPINKVNAAIVSSTSGLVHHAVELPMSHVRFDKTGGESVDVFSVAGGGATYINLGGGVLFDTSYSGDSYMITRALKTYQRGVDSIVLSHADSSHVGAATSVIEEFPIKQVLCAERQSNSTTFKKAIHAAETEGIDITVAQESNRYPISENVFMEIILHGVDQGGTTADDRGLIVRLHWDEHKILFMNDAGYNIEQTLLKGDYDIQADVLVVGQHSHQRGVSQEFIQAVAPHSVIASNGVAYFESKRDHSWITMAQQETKLYLLSDTGFVRIKKEGGNLKLNTPLRVE